MRARPLRRGQVSVLMQNPTLHAGARHAAHDLKRENINDQR
ncbi:hypothetical protein EDC31_11847 [Acidomonas methanolica]|nr:hypothetical protein EDC31_11847 [Acidomonas methanolica]